MPSDLALLLTLLGSTFSCLELIFMVPKVFEPLKFDCICQRSSKIFEEWKTLQQCLVKIIHKYIKMPKKKKKKKETTIFTSAKFLKMFHPGYIILTIHRL